MGVNNFISIYVNEARSTSTSGALTIKLTTGVIPILQGEIAHEGRYRPLDGPRIAERPAEGRSVQKKRAVQAPTEQMDALCAYSGRTYNYADYASFQSVRLPSLHFPRFSECLSIPFRLVEHPDHHHGRLQLCHWYRLLVRRLLRCLHVRNLRCSRGPSSCFHFAIIGDAA